MELILTDLLPSHSGCRYEIPGEKENKLVGDAATSQCTYRQELVGDAATSQCTYRQELMGDAATSQCTYRQEF